MRTYLVSPQFLPAAKPTTGHRTVRVVVVIVVGLGGTSLEERVPLCSVLMSILLRVSPCPRRWDPTPGQFCRVKFITLVKPKISFEVGS